MTLPAPQCLHIFLSFHKRRNFPIFISARQKTHRNCHYVSDIRFPLCPAQHFGSISLLFLLSICIPSFSLVLHSEATTVLIIISVLVRRAGVDESLQTHPCIHTCAYSPCTHRTLMCNRPANSDLNHKYLRKTT